jgi:hypothetical protein
MSNTTNGQTHTHPASFLPNYGLNHSFSELDRVGRHIHTLPVEEQAQYADQWCQQKATDLAFASEQISTSEQEGPRYEMWNTTAVGNVAYLALHAPTEELKSKYRNLLEGYCQWKADNDVSFPPCTVM